MTIPEILFANEPAIRLGAFAGVLAAMALWELVAPRRHQSVGRGRRWPNNLGVVVVDKDRRSPEYLTKFVQSEIARWAVPINASGVTID